MEKPFPLRKASWIAGLLILATLILHATTDDELDRRIKLPQSAGSVYELLTIISRESGYLFIYGEKAVDNNRKARISRGEYSIRQAVRSVTGNPSLVLRLIDNHILIQLPGESFSSGPEPAPLPAPPDSSFTTVEGILLDNYTAEPVAYATVGIPANGVGTVSNLSGHFRLRVADSLRQARMRISHIGYVTSEASLLELRGEVRTIRLEPKVISIQEIVVRLVNPIRLLNEMLDSRERNYASAPVYLTSFYREGVERRKGFINLTEAVFKIYKAPLGKPAADQVKLLKMRRISNEKERDTLLLRMKSGVESCLMLDVVQNLADFITPEGQPQYDYLQTDITEIDGRMAYVVAFEQKKTVDEPLYTGEIYIDAENSALLAARFEVHPKYIEQATPMFVTRKSRNLHVKARRAEYRIAYRQWNGTYYVSHIRGDLYFNIRKAKRLFPSAPIHTWFEMATCRIDTDSVVRFGRSETLRTRTIFADTRFAYDRSFWDDFNIILPEERLSEAIRKVNAKIEEEASAD